MKFLTGKIAVVDDDEMVNEILKCILIQEFKVDTYKSAEDFFENCDFSEIDAIITDVNLPGLSGIDLLQKVHDKDKNMPVIVITGYSDIDIAISALKNGAFDFILKPFNNDQILISVQKATDKRRLSLENIHLMNELQKKNNQLEELNKQIQRRNDQIERDLDIASNLQKCLFPMTFPVIPGLEFNVKFKPIEKISGDFYDYLVHDDRHFTFIFADVSGHGVPAALFSAMVKTAITYIKKGHSPASIIESINKFLINSQQVMSYNYATIFCANIDMNENKIHYSNAGIPAPVVISSNKTIKTLDPNGPFVGLFEQSEYKDASYEFKAGDKLIMFTDGAYEFPDSFDKMLGYQGFVDKIDKIKEDKAKNIVEYLFSTVQGIINPSIAHDDTTILSIEYLEI